MCVPIIRRNVSLSRFTLLTDGETPTYLRPLPNEYCVPKRYPRKSNGSCGAQQIRVLVSLSVRPSRWNMLARCQRQLGEFEEARQLLDDLLAKQARNPRALSERGLLALETKDWDRSEKLLRQAVAQ